MPKSLSNYRNKIDTIDDQILALLNDRACISQEIGKIKQSQKRAVFVPGRESEIYQRLSALNRGPLPETGLRAIFREVISASQALQKNTTVVYLGPKGTFTHLACLDYFGASIDDSPESSIEAVFETVEKDLADFGVIPVENSTEGVVNNTLDLFVDSSLTIYGEICLQVKHNLMSVHDSLEDLDVVYSHPQPIAQCRNFLSRYLPGVRTVAVSSTAYAASLCKTEPHAAAIASSVAATLYGLKILKTRIEDRRQNSTRFLIVSKKQNTSTGNDKTSLIVSIKDAPGALHHTLRIFSEQKINLSMIKSRPSKKKAWEYLFHLDLVGHVDDAPLKKAFVLLETERIELKILGSYPSADALVLSDD